MLTRKPACNNQPPRLLIHSIGSRQPTMRPARKQRAAKESLVGGLGGVAVGARMPRRKDEGLLRPIRASRGSNTLGWCSYLGRQTVCHQSYVHIACPYRLGILIVG